MTDFTYYKIGAKGQVLVWSIEIEDDELRMDFGTLGCEIQTKYEAVEENSVRDIEEQLASRLQSRINKKLDKGYCKTVEEARENIGANLLGYYKPMLAAKYKASSLAKKFRAYCQRKYDGNRCLVTNDGGTLFAYSRNGKPITTIQHILDELTIPEGDTIDGELYHHGTPLGRIRGWISKNQPETKLLTYMIYDVVDDADFEERYNYLCKNIKAGANSEIVETWEIDSDEIGLYFRAEQAAGFEGLMLRFAGPYECDKRSKNLVKVKTWGSEGFEDEEFLVVDIIPSKDGWARLACTTKDGTKFRTSAPGTMAQKHEVMWNAANYIGRNVRCQYPVATEYGKPFHAVAIEWREKAHE